LKNKGQIATVTSIQGGSQIKDASGGSAGGQTFANFYELGLTNRFWLLFMQTFADALSPRNEERGHPQPGVQGIIPWPPEAWFFMHFNHTKLTSYAADLEKGGPK
jgi:hypothetical protein